MTVGTYEGFARHLNETFSVGLGEASVEMTLVQAHKGQPRQSFDGIRAEPFSLIFKCAREIILPQKIYSFEKEGFGKMEIFIVPVGREKDGIVYQAVFN